MTLLSRVEVITAQGALLGLSLGNPSDGITIIDIDGLDPVKAVLVSSSFSSMEGEQYQASRREARDLTFKLGMDPVYGAGTVREIRKRLYSFFMPKSLVTLRFYIDGENPLEIQARVESFDAPMFVKDPEATIALRAFNPDFYDPIPITVGGGTTSTPSEFLIDYDGTTETGIKFHLDIDRPITEFTIFHRPPDNSLLSLEFVGDLRAGDGLDISTIPGAKSATITRAGSDSSILYGVSPYSKWISLEPGPNYLRIYAEGEAIPFTITYTNKYGGL